MEVKHATGSTYRKQLTLILGVLFVIKLLLLPLAQTVDADAVSRTFLTLEWMDHPHWINSGNWLPFHYYLNAVALTLWNNPERSLQVMHLAWSVLTLIPVFYLIKREFDVRTGLLIVIIAGISPIVFRTSFMALSETPYLFFLACGLNLISSGLKANDRKSMLFAGLCFTVASGIRFEAWFLAVLFGMALLLLHRRRAVEFALTASLFPLIWICSSWHETGHFLLSTTGTAGIQLSEGMNVAGNNIALSAEAMARRLWFFPFSWMISIGPVLAFAFFRIGFAKRDGLSRFVTLTFVIWGLTLLFFLFNSWQGALLIQHRFTGTLTVLSLPVIAYYFYQSKYDIRKLGINAVLIVGMSFVYNTSGISPVPRLGDQQKAKLAEVIKTEVNERRHLILDFCGWDFTYYFALHAGLHPKRITLIDYSSTSEDKIATVKKILSSNAEAVVVLESGSPLEQELTKIGIRDQLKLVSSHAETHVFLKSTHD